jgi:hypothetical protein
MNGLIYVLRSGCPGVLGCQPNRGIRSARMPRSKGSTVNGVGIKRLPKGLHLLEGLVTAEAWRAKCECSIPERFIMCGIKGIAGRPFSKTKADEMDGAGFGESAERASGQGALGQCAANQDGDAAHLDCATAEPGQPRLPDVTALPRVQSAAKLDTTILLTLDAHGCAVT